MKRSSGTELTRDNWDAEEKPEEKGAFAIASENELKKRTMLTAKRKISQHNDGQRPVFSGFSSFSFGEKKGKDSFSFLSKISTDSDATHSMNVNKAENDVASKLSDSYQKNLDKDDTVTDIASTAKSSVVNSKGNSVKPVTDIVFKDKTEKDKDDTSPESVYYYKLKCLNMICTNWIVKHVNENPKYILTPIFADYERYLKQIKDERHQSEQQITSKYTNVSSENVNKKPDEDKKDYNCFKNLKPPEYKPVFHLFNKDSSSKDQQSNKSESDTLFKIPNDTSAEKSESKTDTIKPFSFGFSKTSDSVPSSYSNLFNSTPNLPSQNFSFGFGKSLTNDSMPNNQNEPKSTFFSSSINSAAEGTIESKKNENDNADEDEENVEEPTKKVEEDGATYSKRCKIFMKKGDNYVDHGIGILFVKLVNDGDKCQVIVRADSALANVMINVLLTDHLPLQKMGKNNVMMVCCPLPDKPPTTVLVKVKTSEDADELLETLQKYKKK